MVQAYLKKKKKYYFSIYLNVHNVILTFISQFYQ